MVIGVTGHRPKRLDKTRYGYDLTSPGWVELRAKFKDILIENNCTEAISGMTLGGRHGLLYRCIRTKTSWI